MAAVADEAEHTENSEYRGELLEVLCSTEGSAGRQNLRALAESSDSDVAVGAACLLAELGDDTGRATLERALGEALLRGDDSQVARISQALEYLEESE